MRNLCVPECVKNPSSQWQHVLLEFVPPRLLAWVCRPSNDALAPRACVFDILMKYRSYIVKTEHIYDSVSDLRPLLLSNQVRDLGYTCVICYYLGEAG